jgi:hypothetical protein
MKARPRGSYSTPNTCFAEPARGLPGPPGDRASAASAVKRGTPREVTSPGVSPRRTRYRWARSRPPTTQYDPKSWTPYTLMPTGSLAVTVWLPSPAFDSETWAIE